MKLGPPHMLSHEHVLSERCLELKGRRPKKLQEVGVPNKKVIEVQEPQKNLKRGQRTPEKARER